MKQMKKSNPDWKLLSMLPLAGFLAVGMGFAAPAYAGPGIQINPKVFQQRLNIPAARRIVPVKWPADLKVSMALDTSSIRKSNRLCVQGCTWGYTIRGSVKNVGRGAFVPLSNSAQTLNLFGPSPGNASRARLIKSWPFGRLNPGQAKRVSVRVQGQPGPSIEFVTDYTMKITFGPDSPGDRNRRNNQATLRRRTVVSAVNRIITVRPVGVRPGVVRPNIISPKLLNLRIKTKPDLITKVINARSGQVLVRNIGLTTAGPSHLFLLCSRINSHFRGKACVDPSLHLPNFITSQNGFSLNIPALRSGASYRVNLWGTGAMPVSNKVPDTYYMVLTIDWDKHIAESNEGNNQARLEDTFRDIPKPPKLLRPSERPPR